MRTKEVTVEYDPVRVPAEEVRAAVQRANQAMAAREGPEGRSADTIL